MSFKQSDEQIKKDFSFSIKDGIFWVLMNSVAVIFLVPYLISLGANSFQVGFLQSFPIFVTSFLVLISYRLLKFFKSKKKTVVIFVTLQSLMWLPLAFAHFFFRDSVTIWIVIFIYILITGLGMVVNPIYKDWIRRLFPSNKMGSYLARKNIILEFISIFPIFLIGYLLDYFLKTNSLIGYSIIFLSAGLFRFISSRYLNKMSETENESEILLLVQEQGKTPGLHSFKRDFLNDKSFLHFLIFIVLSYLGIYFSTSYVTYFILHSLEYTTVQYVQWKVAYILGIVLSLSYWGHVSDKYNPIKILQISSLFLPFFLVVPAFFYSNYFLMVASIFIAGVIFGAFNLGVINYLYKNIKKDLIGHSSYFLIIQSTAIFIGTLVGAWIISLATRYYGSEFKAIIFLFIFTICFRFIPFIYSLKLQKIEKEDLRFFRYVIVQRPVFYGLLGFTHLSHEEKKLVLNLKINREVLKKLKPNFSRKKH